MTVLQRFGDLAAVPWRNGGGVTREVLVLPVPEPDAGGFLARVSIADVDTGGPFSAYPGVDRVIMLLDGDGMRLRVDGSGEEVALRRNEPFAFDGGATVECEIDSPTRDLNLMTLRGRASGSMTMNRGDAPLRAGGDGATLVVIGLGDGTVAGGIRLEPLDAVICHGAVDVCGDAAVIVIRCLPLRITAAAIAGEPPWPGAC